MSQRLLFLLAVQLFALRTQSIHAESLHSIIGPIGTALIGVRGGDDLGPGDFPQVVILRRRYREKDPLTGTWSKELKTSTCSGSVFNQLCVLLAAHCLPKPNEFTVSHEVFTGNEIIKHLDLVNGDETVREVNAAALVTSGVANGSTTLDATKRFSSLSKADQKKIIGEDIAIFRLDRLLPAENSFTERNLPNQVTYLKEALATVVGSGSYSSTKHPRTGKSKEEGGTVKRSGVVELDDNVGPLQASFKVKSGPTNQLATFGDSGGALLFGHEANHAKAIVAGVISTLDSDKTINGTANDIVSTLFHKNWILETLDLYKCFSPAVKLTKFASENGLAISTYKKDWWKWKVGGKTHGEHYKQMQQVVRDMLVTEGEIPKEFMTVNLVPTDPDKGKLRFNWDARYSNEDPGAPTSPKGVIEIPTR